MQSSPRKAPGETKFSHREVGEESLHCGGDVGFRHKRTWAEVGRQCLVKEYRVYFKDEVVTARIF